MEGEKVLPGGDGVLLPSFRQGDGSLHSASAAAVKQASLQEKASSHMHMTADFVTRQPAMAGLETKPLGSDMQECLHVSKRKSVYKRQAVDGNGQNSYTGRPDFAVYSNGRKRAEKQPSNTTSFVRSKFGVHGIVVNGRLLLLFSGDRFSELCFPTSVYA